MYFVDYGENIQQDHQSVVKTASFATILQKKSLPSYKLKKKAIQLHNCQHVMGTHRRQQTLFIKVFLHFIFTVCNQTQNPSTV